jgi:hypothetical protein
VGEERERGREGEGERESGGESEEASSISSRLETWHEEVVEGCEETCVSIQAATQLQSRGTQEGRQVGASGEGCHVAGYADLVIYGESGDMGEVLPVATALKGQRQVWGRISMHTDRDAPNAGGAPHDTVSDALFEVDISPKFFPEMFPISEGGLGQGQTGGSTAGSVASEGPQRVSVCGLCEHVRKAVHKRCDEGLGVPGRAAHDPHILIMLPQNGHGYSVFPHCHLTFSTQSPAP